MRVIHMSTTSNLDTAFFDQRPKIFIKSISFNDNTIISFERNSIVVFTGANNSGKSQILKDIESHFHHPNERIPVVMNTLEHEFVGRVDDLNFLNMHFSLTQQGFYQPLWSENSYGLDSLISSWKEQRLYNGLHKLFIRRLSTELRLTASNALERCNFPERHSIYKLNQSEELTQKLSSYFRQAFHVDLIVNRNDMQTVPLHVGQAPNQKSITMDRHDEYYAQVAALPKLQEQGDGMRAFASVLLDTFTSDYSVTLIDEPEAFLHPPQARVLGKMLAKNNPNDRQLLIATHSEDFLQGLLDADNDNVIIARINRNDVINQISVLQSEQIKKLWSNPLLRYSNILSGLFHEKVIVCESDYDCLFYQAVIDAMYENKKEITPDILFTHCGGKSRIKDVVNALKSIDVPVVAICDFDLINSRQNFKAITSSFGLHWDGILSENMKIIYDSMNAKTDAWTQIKKIGTAGFTANEPAAYEQVEVICKSAGLFVVPVGEMECFDKTVNKEKKEWVYHVLEEYDLATEQKLQGVRDFLKEVVDYKLI